MPSSTLTTQGRAALAHALSTQPLHIAWGTGLEAWDTMPEDQLPSLVERTELYNEVGRRLVTNFFFVNEDPDGDIVIPLETTVDGTIQKARYSKAEGITPNLYVCVYFDYEDAANAIIREAALFAGARTDPSLPAGQRYFLPSELVEPGFFVAAQIIKPAKNRSPAIRETMEFVLPI